MLETLKKALVDKAVEKREIIRAALHHAADDVLDHRLHDLKVAVEVAERHLRLDHPELGGVARGVGILGAERGAEGVNVAERHSEVLGVELAGDGQARLLAEKVLAVIDLAVGRSRRVLQIQRRDLEHLARALAVRAGDDGGVDVDEAAAREELVHGVGRRASHTERRGEEVRARAQMLNGAQIFDAVALFLQGIVGGGHALDLNLCCLDFERLLGLGRQHDGAAHDERGAHVLRGDLLIIRKRIRIHHDLQIAEARAVVQLDESEGLHIADGLRPAAYGDACAAVLLFVGEERGNSHSFHNNFPSFCGFLRDNRGIICHFPCKFKPRFILTFDKLYVMMQSYLKR